MMQGRTLPYNLNLIQSHSEIYYELEFILLRELNVQYMEYIIGDNNSLSNFRNKDRLNLILKQTNIKINSVILNIFLNKNIYCMDYEKYIYEIYKIAKILNIRNIVIPLLEESSLKKIKTFKINKNLFKDIQILVETDLNCRDTYDLISYDNFNLCYDIGNATFNKFDLNELKIFKDKICEIHLKDKDHEGNNVKFGDGIVDFKNSLKKINTYFNSKKVPKVLESMQNIKNNSLVKSFIYCKENLSFIDRYNVN